MKNCQGKIARLNAAYVAGPLTYFKVRGLEHRQKLQRTQIFQASITFQPDGSVCGSRSYHCLSDIQRSDT